MTATASKRAYFWQPTPDQVWTDEAIAGLIGQAGPMTWLGKPNGAGTIVSAERKEQLGEVGLLVGVVVDVDDISATGPASLQLVWDGPMSVAETGCVLCGAANPTELAENEAGDGYDRMCIHCWKGQTEASL